MVVKTEPTFLYTAVYSSAQMYKKKVAKKNRSNSIYIL